MKVVYIMRGVPGSGKSTLARTLANGTGAIHSTDDFFYVVGEYRFDPSKLPENHNRNFAAFCCSLNAGISTVICDNTNGKRWNYEQYVRAAEQAGYRVAIVMMPHPAPEVAAARNIHRVPITTIRRMIDVWES
ncbi:MAG TPA: ATP-binding protein [Candidatus Nanoarchaeia archaeon]|nr:ATP-binding protein [Candidatus Nanoarchaeia archaeon]